MRPKDSEGIGKRYKKEERPLELEGVDEQRHVTSKVPV